MKGLTIPHYRGLKSNYNAETHKNGIYFTTDTHEIIANEISYGDSIKSWSIADGVLTLAMSSGENVVITFNEATTTAKGLMSAADKAKLETLETELTNKVDKEDGKSLVADTDITKISNLPTDTNSEISSINTQITNLSKTVSDNAETTSKAISELETKIESGSVTMEAISDTTDYDDLFT